MSVPGRKLGRNPVRHDPRTLMLRAVLKSGLDMLPAAPPARDWSQALNGDIPMFANDRFGCCTCASVAHILRTWSANKGNALVITDDQVLAAYSAITGFKPEDPSTDGGANMLDVLNYWRNVGFAGHKLGAFAKIDHNNFAEMQLAINLFGSIYVGVNLPLSAQREGDWVGPETTKGPDAPDSWGGHCTPSPKYSRLGLGFLTWARLQPADRQWCADYVEEAYAPIAPEWVADGQLAPNGLDVNALRGYLGRL